MDTLWSLVFLLGAFVSLTNSVLGQSHDDSVIHKQHRSGKFLFPFQIVTFPNEACQDSSGICYTSSECSERGGTVGRSCAGGFGVCCRFSVGCGSTRSENCTYFQGQTDDAGDCSATICNTNSNICQLRLDFEDFVISEPSTSTDVVITDSMKTLASRCLDDTFQVISSGTNQKIPLICGSNSGEHMYVDTNPEAGCTDLVLQFGGSVDFDRSWSIKVTQYACDFPNLAPPGCTQYFSTETDTVKSFNFEGGQHLANQDQKICVRREQNSCRICWYTDEDDDEDFMVSILGTGPSFCVSDYVIFPGAEGMVGTMVTSKICGNPTDLELPDNPGNAVTICSI